MNAKMIRIVSKIHALTSKGWEYPEAEWRVIRHLDRKPAGPDILAAYERFCAEFDAECSGCYSTPCICDPE